MHYASLKFDAWDHSGTLTDNKLKFKSSVQSNHINDINQWLYEID